MEECGLFFVLKSVILRQNAGLDTRFETEVLALVISARET